MDQDFQISCFEEEDHVDLGALMVVDHLEMVDLAFASLVAYFIFVLDDLQHLDFELQMVLYLAFNLDLVVILEQSLVFIGLERSVPEVLVSIVIQFEVFVVNLGVHQVFDRPYSIVFHFSQHQALPQVQNLQPYQQKYYIIKYDQDKYKLKTYSGSLYNTFNEFFNVASTLVRAFLLSVMFAGSPSVPDKDLLVFT